MKNSKLHFLKMKNSKYLQLSFFNMQSTVDLLPFITIVGGDSGFDNRTWRIKGFRKLYGRDNKILPKYIVVDSVLRKEDIHLAI